MMSSSLQLKVLITATLLCRGVAVAQIPVEVFGGNKKATLDVMFFKYFKANSGTNSRFLFFNRNRVGTDYTMTTTTNLPQFGFTEAISYNHQKLKGFAPVALVQIFGSGVYSKTGVQYAHNSSNLTLFWWLVGETKKDPVVDLFFLGRYSPQLTEKVNLYSQLELVNTATMVHTKKYTFIQRIRLGLKLKACQFGFAADFSSYGSTKLNTTKNIGVFLRYEY